MEGYMRGLVDGWSGKVSGCMHESMDGLMDGRFGAWVEREGECVDAGMHAWMHAWMDGWMDAWMGGWMVGCMDGWMDGWMDG